MKRTIYVVTFAAVTFAINVLAWNDSLLPLQTGLKIKTLTEAEVAARKWGPITDGFQISIATDNPAYQLGNPIVVSVLLRNVSGQPLWFSQTDMEADYDIEIAGSDGKAAPLTPYGQRIHALDRPILHAYDVTLKPAESIEHTLALDKLYDVRRADVYNVRVTRKVPEVSAPQTNGAPRLAEIRSNTIRITLFQSE
jgi:hypothetical protein